MTLNLTKQHLNLHIGCNSILTGHGSCADHCQVDYHQVGRTKSIKKLPAVC